MDDYNFIIRTVQSGVIRILFETLKEVLTEIVLVVDERGITLNQMDSSKILLVHVKLVPKNFELFECKSPMNLGVNLSDLFKFLKTAGNNETITFSVKKSDTAHLNIKLENNVKNTVKDCNVKLLSLDMDVLNVPNIKFDAFINMPTNEFQTICKNLSNISDTITIESTDNRVNFIADGDSGSITINIGESNSGIEFKNQDEKSPYAKGVFCLKSLMSFSKSANLCNMVEIFLKDQNPLVLLYKIANLGSIKYLLCPKADEY
jgi:proliferating cell nuclear antigen